jgi:excisionase family DNA binding protein
MKDHIADFVLHRIYWLSFSRASSARLKEMPTTLLSPLEPLLDVKAVARLLGMHGNTIRKLVRSGQLPGVLIGRQWRFRPSQLAVWLDRKTTSLSTSALTERP